MPERRKSNTNFVAEQPKQGWAYFEETGKWRKTPDPWGAPRDHFPREYGDWFAVSKPLDWQPPAGTLAGESLLDGGAAGLNAAGGSASGTKIGAGHKPQGYDAHGRYTGPQGGAISTGGGPVRLFANEADGESDGEESTDEDAANEQEAELEEATEDVQQELEGVLVADSGRVVSDAGGSAPGTDNEAWRLKEKQYTPEILVQNAKTDLGSDKWAPKEVDGEPKNQCNIFVASKLRESGAHVPNVGGTAGTLGAENSDMLNAYTGGRMGGQTPSANDWYKGKVPGYEEVNIKDGEIPRPGDIAASKSHVGIVSGAGKTISVTTANPEAPEYGHVIENEWGFKKAQEGKVTFWRNSR